MQQAAAEAAAEDEVLAAEAAEEDAGKGEARRALCLTSKAVP